METYWNVLSLKREPGRLSVNRFSVEWHTVHTHKGHVLHITASALWCCHVSKFLITWIKECRWSPNYHICACISRTFFDKNLPSKIGVRLIHEILCLFFRTESTMLVLYVVKLPVESASVWDCYVASYCARANAPTY
jgi:hypothetical protein